MLSAVQCYHRRMSALLGEEMLVPFAILATGSWIGRWSLHGFILGTAGVLFVALVLVNVLRWLM
jgi:hypothetical protein